MGFLTIKKHFLLYYFKLIGVMNVGVMIIKIFKGYKYENY
jgi:hypothetical protein